MSKTVDPGKVLEQDGLALHHRLARQGPHVAQPQHRGAVRNHRHQIALVGVAVGVLRVGVDVAHRLCDPGGIGERQVVLGLRRLGDGGADLSGGRLGVVIQCTGVNVRVGMGLGVRVGHDGVVLLWLGCGRGQHHRHVARCWYLAANYTQHCPAQSELYLTRTAADGATQDKKNPAGPALGWVGRALIFSSARG